MVDVLNRNRFLVQEHAGLLEATFNFDIRDPESGDLMLECRETGVGRLTRFFRFSDYKRTTPFHLHVRTPGGKLVMSVTRGIPIVVSRVRVFDESDVLIGGFKQKSFSIRGAFDVLDAEDHSVCRLDGRRGGTAFRFVAPGDIELAQISKQWAGLKKELFTSADHYLLEIDEAVPQDESLRRLILASVICIGMVMKIELP